jgi:glycosyltransferase involved in cell wall biosynthesis
MAHKLDFILECAPDAPDNVHFLFIGDGAEKPKLLEMKEQMNLSNVTFLPPVPKHEIARYISLTDVALVPLKKSDTFKTVIPSKIFENASMEKPILLGVEGESQAIIEKYQAGLCFEPENRADFQKQLRAISMDSAQYKQLQQGCQALSRNFNRKSLAQKLYQVIETVTS